MRNRVGIFGYGSMACDWYWQNRQGCHIKFGFGWYSQRQPCMLHALLAIMKALFHEL
jgi:hypothetical protein